MPQVKAKGLDLSKYQGLISVESFKKIKEAGYSFVILKATEGGIHGSNIQDPDFLQNFKNATEADLEVHAYHYFLGVSVIDAKDEADNCLQEIKKTVGFKGYVFCDVEDKSLSKDPRALSEYVNSFFEHMATNGYKSLGIYASEYFYKDNLDNGKYLRTGILHWIAAYNNTGAGVPCAIWQNSSSGSVPGIQGHVDTDISYSDLIGESPKPKAQPSLFSDVSENSEEYKVIQKAVGLNLIHGFPDGTFKPNETLTRVQAAEIAVNIYEACITNIQNAISSTKK